MQKVDVEKTLKKQVVVDIEKIYIKELRYIKKDTIIMTVAELLTHIFASYGLFDAIKIKNEERKVALMVWNLNDTPFYCIQ